MITELRDLFSFNRWANERVLAACSSLLPDDLTRELGGSFPSVWATLAHLYAAENTWLARWEGTPTGAPSDLGDIHDVPALCAKWNTLWDRQSKFIANVTDAEVRRAMAIVFRDGRSFEQQMGATMRHCVNHATYHRGQVTNFLRMLGADTVGTDLVLYYMEHPPTD
jgi:uncharacterized damage-inducible protein DinB